MSRTPVRWLLLAVLVLTPGLTPGSAVLAQAQGQGAQDPGPDPGLIRIGTYNIENAFDVFDDPYTEDEGAGVKPRGELEDIAKALRKLDADVVGVQEVENEGILRALVHDYLGDMGYDYIAVDTGNDGRGIKVGVISRLPIISMTSYRWQSFTHPQDPDRVYRFSRDLMHVQLRVPTPAPGSPEASANPADSEGRVLHLFVAHLKSKFPSTGDPKSTRNRTAEALHARQIIGALEQREPAVLAAMVGDFNTDLNEPAYNALFGQREGGAGDGTPTLIDTQKEIGPKDARITHPGTDYPPVVFDYVAASPALAKLQVPGSATIIKDKALTAGSDHRPVSTTFDLTPND